MLLHNIYESVNYSKHKYREKKIKIKTSYICMYYVEIAVLSHVYAHVKHKHIETEKTWDDKTEFIVSKQLNVYR